MLLLEEPEGWLYPWQLNCYYLKVYGTDIPRSVRAAEISAEGKSIFAHDPKGKVAEAYQTLTKEVMHNAEKRRKHQLEQLR